MMSTRRVSVFVGSSAEGLAIAEAVQVNLDYDCEVTLWSQGVFGLGNGSLESLVQCLDKFDFAALILTADDLVESRSEKWQAPRDNVLLELGLFLGKLGRQRTFIVYDRTKNLKLPSDLAGVTAATFEPHTSGELRPALGAPSTLIKEAIKKLGARDRRGLSIAFHADFFTDGGSDLVGIAFTVTNTGAEAIPPYRLAIFHPGPPTSTRAIFPSRIQGELLPEQNRRHKCYVFQQPGAPPPVNAFADEEVDPDLFSMRVYLEHSDKVLHENRRLGRDFVRVYRKVWRAGSFAAMTGDDAAALTSSPEDE